jgi:hypothetical protein
MDIISSIASGFVVKIYDDFTENGIITDGFLKESLHTLSCLLLGASAMGDFVFVLLLYSVNFINNISDARAFSELKEKSILYTYPVFFLLTLPAVRSLSVIETITLIWSCFIIYNESSIIKEEVSIRKLTSRLILIVATVFVISCATYFNLMTKSLTKLFLFGLAYLSASCCFQAYTLYNKHVEIKDLEFPKWFNLNKASDIASHRPDSQPHTES